MGLDMGTYKPNSGISAATPVKTTGLDTRSTAQKNAALKPDAWATTAKKALEELRLNKKEVKKLQSEVLALKSKNIEAEANRNVAYVFSLLLLILFIAAAIKQMNIFSKVRYLKNSPEVSDEFKKKRTMLADLLKSEAISYKEYKQKMKKLTYDTSVIVKQAKLNEALNSKVISEDEFNSKSSKI